MTTNLKSNFPLKLTCEICLEPFNLENHLPKFLLCCGKSLCRSCLQDILKKSFPQCPWCECKITSNTDTSKTNLQLVSIIEEDSQWEKCPGHGENMKLFCLKDRQKLCAYCGLSSECKNHELVHLNDMKHVFGERIKELQDCFTKVQGKAKKYDEVINKRRDIFEGILNETFDKQIEELKQMKAKTLMKLTSFFNEKRSSVAESLGKQEASLRAEVQAKVYEHLNFFKIKDPVWAMREDMLSLQARVDSLLGESQEVGTFEQNLTKLVSLGSNKSTLEQKEDFDVLIKSLKDGTSQKRGQQEEEFLENKRVLDEEEEEEKINVEVSGMRFHLQMNPDVLTCGRDLDKHVKTLSLGVKQIREVAEVFINIGSFDLNEINLKAIECVLSNIVQISRVSLFLQSTLGKISLERISSLFSAAFRKPQEMSHITIFFPPNDELVRMFNVFMAQFSSLKGLKVHFFPGKYSLDICEEFVGNLSLAAYRLEKLDLNFSGTNFPILALKKKIIFMPNLEELSLNASRMADFDDLTLNLLVREMKYRTPKLFKFHIEASGTEISKHFAEGLKSEMSFIPQFSINSNCFKKEPIRQRGCGCCDV